MGQGPQQLPLIGIMTVKPGNGVAEADETRTDHLFGTD